MSRLGCLFALLVVGCTGEIVSDGDATDSEADADQTAQLDDIEALLASADTPVDGHAMSADDRDGDGIPDATEELLLRRYRPVFRFSQTSGGDDEDFRPANPVDEIANAQLKVHTDGGTSDPLPGCGRAGDHHIDPPESLYTCRPDASFLVAHGKTDYALNLANARYHGVSFDQAKAEATGLYGHVAPTTIDGHDAYKIEYWQFFAFNNQDITVLGLGSFGDHEGDWTSVQLWFDRELHRLVRVRYLIHGKSATFNIPALDPTCHDCTIDVHGPNYNANPPNFFDDEAAYSDNAAQFYLDAQRYKHVVVYVERGGHESWPGPWGHAQINVGPLSFHLNPHNGNGPSYLVPAVTDRLLNMGEVDHPLTEAGKLILQYDGYWGSTNTTETVVGGPQRRSPVGPALHCSWRWPDGRTVAGCEG